MERTRQIARRYVREARSSLDELLDMPAVRMPDDSKNSRHQAIRSMSGVLDKVEQRIGIAI